MFNFLTNLSLEHILFWSSRHAKKRKLCETFMRDAWLDDEFSKVATLFKDSRLDITAFGILAASSVI